VPLDGAAAGVAWGGVGLRPSTVADRRPGSSAVAAGATRRAPPGGSGVGEATLAGAPGAPTSVPARPLWNSTPHPSHRRGQPRVRVPHDGQRPGGAASSSPTAIGPRAAPNTNQAAHERPRWTASQLATGAKTIPETTNAMTGSGNRTRLLCAGLLRAPMVGGTGRTRRHQNGPETVHTVNDKALSSSRKHGFETDLLLSGSPEANTVVLRARRHKYFGLIRSSFILGTCRLVPAAGHAAVLGVPASGGASGAGGEDQA
jgi:hypothetical protein